MTFETEVTETPRFSLRRLLRVIGPLFRLQAWHFLGAFLLLAASSALVVVGPILVRRAIDVDIAGQDWNGLQRTVLIYLAAMLAHMVVFYTMRNWLEWAGQNMMADLKRTLFAHLLNLPLAFHDRHGPGKLMSRVENDTEALRMLFTTTGVMLLGDALLFVGMFTAMFAAEPRLAAIVLLVLPPILISGWWVNKRCRPYFLASRGLTADLCGRLAEFIQGTEVIQAYARTRWAVARFQDVNLARYRAEFSGEVRWMAWFNGMFFMEAVAFALILGVGGAWALQGLVTLGTLIMFMGYVRRFFEPLMRLSDQMLIVQKAGAAAERVAALLDEPVIVADPAEPVPWPGLHQGITFENVFFRYAADGDWILRDVSIHIPSGEQWAVVGPTGAGKTTLISLLLRFYDPDRGRVLIDGVDIRDLDPRDLRRRVGLVLQDLYLFPGNLEDNLRLGRDVSEDQLQRAVRSTLAESVIGRLPGGLAAELAERGSNLSHGERQLLAFTRAVAHDPEMLILDEATSAVDPATEAAVQAGLEQILSGRTAVIIAHRLSTIRSAHRILVMRDGEIVEQGTHAELTEAGGLYRDLCRLQFREEEDHASQHSA